MYRVLGKYELLYRIFLYSASQYIFFKNYLVLEALSTAGVLEVMHYVFRFVIIFMQKIDLFFIFMVITYFLSNV